MQRLYRIGEHQLISYVHPNGNLSRIGDGDLTDLPPSGSCSRHPPTRFRAQQWYAGRSFPNRPFNSIVHRVMPCFAATGRFRLRSESSYLFFTASFHSRTHKQADDFTFEWADHGQELVIDSGNFATTTSNPPAIRRQHPRHNTVEIDGRDYSRYRLDAFGSAILPAANRRGQHIFVEAEVDRKRFFQTIHQTNSRFSARPLAGGDRSTAIPRAAHVYAMVSFHAGTRSRQDERELLRPTIRRR